MMKARVILNLIQDLISYYKRNFTIPKHVRNDIKRLSLTTLLSLLSAPTIALATNGDSSQGLGCGGGLGPLAKALCGVTEGEIVGQRLNVLFSGIIGFMTIAAGLWFIFQFLSAGYKLIGAGGDKAAVEEAIARMRNAIVGLIVVAAAWVIVGVIGKMLGLDILNPGLLIQTLGQ